MKNWMDLPFGRSLIAVLLSVSLAVLAACGSGDGTAENSGIGGASDTVVFIANKDDFNKDELFVSSDNGGDIEKLNGVLVNGGNVTAFQVSPDGRRVAYTADQNTDGTIELFTVRVDGSQLRNISRGGLELLQVEDFTWAPDGSRIAYRAFSVANPRKRLFTDLSGGGDQREVSIVLNPGGDGDVSRFEWSPDSSSLAYLADAFLDGKIELFATRAQFRDNFNPSGSIPDNADVANFAWAPDSSLLLFISDININDFEELFVGDRVGRLGRVSGSGEVLDAAWAPGSDYIAYIADDIVISRYELFTAFRRPGGIFDPPVRVSGSSMAGAVSQFTWAPNGSRIAYLADQEKAGVDELFTSRPGGSENRRVSKDLTGLSGQVVMDFTWAPDSSRIAYKANQDVATREDLYTTAPDRIDFLKITKAANAGSAEAFEWAFDSSRLAYIAEETAGTFELFSATPSGGSIDTVSVIVDPGRIVTSFKWSTDSERIAYRTDQDVKNKFELFSAEFDGGDNKKLSGSLADTRDVADLFEWVP